MAFRETRQQVLFGLGREVSRWWAGKDSENRRIVWITLWGSVTPPSTDGNRKPQGSKGAVLRANKGEGSHRRGIHSTVEGGWELSCWRKTSK